MFVPLAAEWQPPWDHEGKLKTKGEKQINRAGDLSTHWRPNPGASPTAGISIMVENKLHLE